MIMASLLPDVDGINLRNGKFVLYTIQYNSLLHKLELSNFHFNFSMSFKVA